MAQRRMISLKIINTANFIKMPTSSQCLYFHLALHADDDGIVEAFNIMRLTGNTEDDLKILVAKKFVYILNEDLVAFIMDWNEHNLIRADRKIDSKYKSLLLQILPDSKLLESKSRTEATKEIRKEAYNNSELPYSFTYKIKQAFWGEKCPICGITMDVKENNDKDFIPSIQHNIPISKGGKHELDNISVICRKCNVKTVDRPTKDLNSEKVKEVWYGIIGQSNDNQMSAQVRLGKVRLELGNDKQATKKVADKPKLYDLPIPDNLKTDAFIATWKRWVDYKRKTTRISIDEATATLAWLSGRTVQEAINCIEIAIRNGWKGCCFEPKNKFKPEHKKAGHVDKEFSTDF